MFAVVAGACRSPAAPDSAVAVSVTLAQTVVPTGTGVATIVTAQNIGGAVVRLTGGSGCLTYLEVRNAAGATVGGDSRICVMNLVQLPVAPHDAVTERPTWDGRMDRVSSPAAPGVYTLRGGVTLADGRQVWSEPVPLTVTVR